MEAPDLASAEYWHSEGVDIRVNPAIAIEKEALDKAIESRGITSAIVLATSGTSGRMKWIVLSKSAMLASAEAVNQWCGITENDTWLGGLSTFHVGGLGIYCRAHLTGSTVNSMAWDQWTRDGKAFLDSVRDSTITSLTPIHLYDLVTAGVRCPGSLRGVFIGGGALSNQLAGRAHSLGWPIWTTYGMTEACSQIATSLEGDTERLPVLPHWTTGVSKRGELMIKGSALMSGYFSGPWDWHPATNDEGFYTTGDLVTVDGDVIQFHGRADDQIKILGELVSPAKLEESLGQRLNRRVVIYGIPESRRGAKLLAVVESDKQLLNEFKDWNQSLPAFQRIDEVHWISEFPRTESGKVDRVAVKALELP